MIPRPFLRPCCFVILLGVSRLWGDTPDAVVTINEIHYNPPGSQDAEWIELHNQMAVNVDISGWSLSDGVTYKIPPNTVIAGGGYRLIAKLPGHASLTGIPNVLGPFTGNLSNSGETIDLLNSSGRLMDRLAYADSGDWPIAADGAGASLAKRKPGLAAANPANWRASSNAGGSPANANFPAPDQPLVHAFADQSSTWKFYDAASAPSATWNTVAFNDAAWQQGQPAFGTPSGTPTLGVTANLNERFRAGALTGLVDGAQFSTWPDTALGDGVAQDATNGSEPRYETNATPSGQPTVSFDGNDSFRTSVSPSIGPTSGFTYFVVCRATAAPDSGGTNGGDGDYIFDRDHLALGQDNPLASLKVSDGRFGFQKRYDDGSGLGGPVSTTALSQTNFQIVAIRRNTALSRFEVWVDGNMEGSEADSGAALTPQPIVIGCHSNNTANGFRGHIAELLIYRSSLSDAEFNSVGTYLEGRYGLTTAFPDSNVQTPISATASTSYYRHSFNFTGEPSRTVLKLNHTVADGAVFYLNGQELTRTNMPGGAAGHATSALSDLSSPSSSGFLTVPSTALVTGTNVLAVSVHTGATDNTAYFSAELQGLESPIDPDLPSALQLNEIAASNAPTFFVELRNPTAVSSSTAGFTLELIGSQTASFPLPAGSVPAGGFVSYTEAQLGFRPAVGDKVILRSPGGSLADVQAADSAVRGAATEWPGRWLFPSVPTPGIANSIPLTQDIVINEICYHPPEINAASEDKQWLELYNRGANPVNLSGWSFGAGVDFDFPNGTVIAPGGYLVIAKNPSGLLSQFPGINVAGPYGGSLAGSGERILLLDAAGNPADDVAYVDGGRWPGTPDGGGTTLELRDPRSDNSLPESWVASNESSRRSWQTYTYKANAATSAVGPDGQWREFVLGMLDEGEVLLDDITVTERPGVAPVAMISGGNFEGGLPAGWRFIGNHRNVQLVQDPDNAGNTVLYLNAKGPTEHMHNHVEATLAGGRSVTNGYEYEISFKARWLSGANLLNTRLYFNRCAKTTALTRTDNPGTPGSANSTALANAGPSFSQFKHSPVVPSPGEAVTVTARATDPDGLGAFSLKYSVDGGTIQTVAMSAGADGTFTGTIPGQTAAKVVRFWVIGNDAALVPASATFPRDGTNSHALYQVNDSLAATNGRHNIRIIMAPAEKALLYQENNLMSNERLGCTVIYDEHEIYYDVGVRLKSSQRGRPAPARVGFSVGFNRDQLFRGVHRTVSIDRSEGQITGCQEILYDHMMYASGSVPAEYNDLCKVIAPDPAHTSSAILQLARYGDVFLDSQFPDGGDGTSYEYELIYYPTSTDANGYKLPQPDNVVGTDIRDLGDDKENYRHNFLIENNEDKDDYSRIIALGKQFQKSAPAFEAGLTDVINVDQWLRALACSCISGAGDSFYANANHNGIFYAGTDGRVLYFPHDMDFSFSATRSIDENSELQKLIADPLRKRVYLGHLYDICTRVFNNSYMQTWTTHYGSLLPGEDFAGHLNYITQRSNYILGQVNAHLPSVPFAITTNGGANFSTATSPVTLAGTGWVDVRDIRLAGATAPLQVTWTSNTTWQISVPLSVGANVISLEGLNYAGEVVQTDSITVTNTGTIQVPTPATLVVSKIYYNPPGSTETTEYVELMNASSTLTLDLSNVNFTAGLSFTFPGGTMLTPGARTLIVKDVTAFNTAFGSGKPIAGTFPVNLDNGGAQIVLRKANGDILHDFNYDDEPPWPLDADGEGYALVLVNPRSNPDHSDPLSWRASAQTGGNPGSADTMSYAAWKSANGNHADDADLDGDGLSTRLEYFMGGNPAVADQGLAPMFFLEEDGSITISVARSATAEDVVPAAQVSTQLSSWQTPANIEFLSTERVPGSPARDLLTFSIVPPPGTPQYFVRFNFGP